MDFGSFLLGVAFCGVIMIIASIVVLGVFLSTLWNQF